MEPRFQYINEEGNFGADNTEKFLIDKEYVGCDEYSVFLYFKELRKGILRVWRVEHATIRDRDVVLGKLDISMSELIKLIDQAKNADTFENEGYSHLLY